MSKKQTPALKAYNAALGALATTFETAKAAIDAGAAKAGELLKSGINAVLDKGRAADVDGGDMVDAIKEKIDAAIEAGQLAKSSGRAYMVGVRFAVDRRVAWHPSLQNKADQVKALEAAGKAIPKSLAEEAAKQAAKREAKNGKVREINDANVVKMLAKALADARTLGKPYAADILDCIHKIDPAFKEPTAEEASM